MARCMKCITNNGRLQVIDFANPQARLPLKTRTNQMAWMRWGRHPYQRGELPLGSCLLHDRILQGQYDEFFPKPVKIMAKAFMEYDISGNECWYEVMYGQCIQGALLHYKRETRVYVTSIIPDGKDMIHELWPRILFNAYE